MTMKHATCLRVNYVISVVVSILTMTSSDKSITSEIEDVIRLNTSVVDVEIKPNDSITFNCLSHTRSGNNSVLFIPEDFIPRLNNSVYIKNVKLLYCASPSTSYVNMLESMNVKFTNINEVSITSITIQINLTKQHIEGLNMNSLQIKLDSLSLPKVSDSIILAENFFESLTNLKNVTFSAVKFFPLPLKNRIQHMYLEHSMSVREWGGCEKLEELSLRKVFIELMVRMLPEDLGVFKRLLAHCPKLKSLRMELVSRFTMQVLVTGASQLRHLSVKKCFGEAYWLSRNLLNASTHLQELVFTYNKLVGIESGAFNSQMRTLELLDLSNNKIRGEVDTLNPLTDLKALKELSLAHNDLRHFCGEPNTSNATALYNIIGKLNTLERLSLKATNLHVLCEYFMAPKLKFLDVSDNKIIVLEVTHIPIYYIMIRAYPLEIDVRGNPLREVVLLEAEYEMMGIGRMLNNHKTFKKPKAKIIADTLNLDCDCQHILFYRSVQLGALELPGVQCAGTAANITAANPDLFECEKYDCSGCWCRRKWRDNTTVARCEPGNSTAVPHEPGLVALHAAGRLLSDLLPEDLPETLHLLDIRNNRLSRMSMETSAALFAVPERQVWVAGNPVSCVCDNFAMIETLSKHRAQVVDYDNITCLETGLPLPEDPTDVCSSERRALLITSLAATGAVLAFAAITTALYFRFKKEINMYAFAHGWFLSCIEEKDLDEDRQYDVFISYAHGDETLVMEELMPGLEPEYSVCVHHRDWIPGEMIPTQISRSVEMSRRTIIVLSRNFKTSMWSMLEFHTAYSNSQREGRLRVVVVVLDNVIDDEDLDPDLRCYLRTSTYLRWDDSSFWRKLRYALPHRPLGAAIPRMPQAARLPTPRHVFPALMPRDEIELDTVADP